MSAMPPNDTPVEADITQPTTVTETLKMLVRYKAWANALTFDTVMSLPAGEALRQRPTRFGNMVHTLNHVYVVDDIFKHHLQGDRKSVV